MPNLIVAMSAIRNTATELPALERTYYRAMIDDTRAILHDIDMTPYITGEVVSSHIAHMMRTAKLYARVHELAELVYHGSVMYVLMDDDDETSFEVRMRMDVDRSIVTKTFNLDA